MLIYNSQKKFLGIDERDLNLLGFSTLESLMHEVDDFADLFVKTPGFIHNFKHVHWIDFVACANPGEDPQAIISVNNKNFKCKIAVETLFLAESASAKSFIVHLGGLRELSKRESEEISGDVAARPLQSLTKIESTPETIDAFDTPEIEKTEYSAVQEDPYETPLEVDFESDDDSFDLLKESEDVAVETKLATDSYKDEMIDVGDLSEDDLFVEEQTTEQTQETKDETQYENYDNGYVYDPHVASDELGLPLDLIEEFIQDFIAQAKEFKPGIYTALDSGEFDQVKILSHKLKGVAANLRIEDAFEALSVVNTSQNSGEILENLDIFYKIIAKLAGEEVATQMSKASQPSVEAEQKEEVAKRDEPKEPEQQSEDLYDDLLDIDLEEDLQEKSIADDDVPQKIEIPELADDDFVSTEIDFKDIEGDIKGIDDLEDIDLVELDEKEFDNIEDDAQELDNEIAPDLEEFSYDQEELFVNAEELKKRAAGEIGIDLESYDELFGDYMSESISIINSIKDELAAGNLEACRYEAMKLQGMSENMRIKSFEKELEQLIYTTETSDSHQLVDALNTIEDRLTKISKAGA